MSEPTKRYTLSVKDVAARLGCSAKHVYTMAEQKEITHLRTHGQLGTRIVEGKPQTYRMTGRIRFAEEDVQAWIEAHMRTAVAAPEPVKAPPPSTHINQLPMPAVRRFSR